MKEECRHCGKTRDEITLRKCQICFKYFCDEHAVPTSGVSFCSSGCGQYYFYVDPEDDE